MNNFHFCLTVCTEAQILDFNLWNITYSNICSKSTKKEIGRQSTKYNFYTTLNKYFFDKKFATKQ